MTIETKISLKEYVRLLLTVTYRRPLLILLLLFALLVLSWIVIYRQHLVDDVPEPGFYQYTTLVLILIIQPLVVFYTIVTNYQSSGHLKEKLKIQFTAEEIMITGETFYTELTWTKLYKITEMSKWFMIYQNNLSAIIIPKRSLQGNQEHELREMLRSVKGIPVHLEHKI